MLNGRWRGQDLGACTDCRRYWTEYRAGTIGDAELGEIEEALFRSHGHCMVMGTASTMAAVAEALGMTLPGGAAIPAPDSPRLRLAEETGRRIVGMVEEDLRPSRILTRGGVRERDPRLHGARRLDQRGRPPCRHRRPGRDRPAARPLRRAQPRRRR